MLLSTLTHVQEHWSFRDVKYHEEEEICLFNIVCRYTNSAM